MRNLPHHAFSHNQTWLDLSLIAQDLLAWTKLICLDGDLAKAETKRLRQRLLHVAARLAAAGPSSSSARVDGRVEGLRAGEACDWPWSKTLAAAFKRLRALTARC